MVVIGGGLAGIATAVHLTDLGVAVTVVETRKQLGGRATSFIDPRTGQVLDNCQHVLLGCCTNLIHLYERLGVAHLIRWHKRLYFADGRGTIDQLEADDLPAPAHLTRSLMAFRSLRITDKLAIMRGMMTILRLGQRGRDRLGHMSFAQWLADHHQPDTAVRKFWSVIVTSALNESPERMDAAYAIQVFQDGFLSNATAYVVGLPAVPLVRLYDAAQRVIQEKGGRVLLSASAERFDFDGRRITALNLANGHRLEAQWFVSALPFDRLAKVCPTSMRVVDPRLSNLDKFVTSPIIGIHLWFGTSLDRLLMRLPHLILTESPLHWIFNKGYDPKLGAQHLHAVVSAARDLVEMPASQILALAQAEVCSVLGVGLGDTRAGLVDGRVIKEKRATFSAVPNVDRLRPAARGPILNLLLAGDWCNSGWPPTMEGAVRSGFLAGRSLVQDAVWTPTQVGPLAPGPPVADLPNDGLYRFFEMQM